MKSVIVMLAVCALLAGGCASDKQESSGATTQQKPSQKDPEVGMTKDQILAMYGKTENIQVSSEGEVWTYNLNMGEAFIPFNFGYRPKLRVIHFDKEGKVTSWSYSK